VSDDRQGSSPGGSAGAQGTPAGPGTPGVGSAATRDGGLSLVVRRRMGALQVEESRLLGRWERDRRRFVSADERLQSVGAMLETRILKAMRWPDSRAWWRTNRRVEAGELWVGHNAEARWLQRVVYATRGRVLELAARRDIALAPLHVARSEAGRALQTTTRRFVATAGRERVLVVLGVPSAALGNLMGGKPVSLETAAILRDRP